MSLGIKWPPHIGLLRVTHNAHQAYNQPVEEYWREQSAFKITKDSVLPFVSRRERDKSIVDNELWELEYQPDRSSKPVVLWAASFDALIDYINDPENSHG